MVIYGNDDISRHSSDTDTDEDIPRLPNEVPHVVHGLPVINLQMASLNDRFLRTADITCLRFDAIHAFRETMSNPPTAFRHFIYKEIEDLPVTLKSYRDLEQFATVALAKWNTFSSELKEIFYWTPHRGQLLFELGQYNVRKYIEELENLPKE